MSPRTQSILYDQSASPFYWQIDTFSVRKVQRPTSARLRLNTFGQLVDDSQYVAYTLGEDARG
jgi:hypothetical protein